MNTANTSHANSLSATAVRWLILATALVAITNLFTALGDLPLSRVQEVRVAETAQEMLGRHEYLTPWFNGELRFQKPPLAYWLAISGYRIFGEVSEFSLRFLTACFGAGSLLLLFRFVRKHADTFTACFSVLCMASCIIPLKMARVAETDTPLLFFIIAAVALGYELLCAEIRRPATGLMFFVAMSLGVLSKGPPGFAIPLGLFLLTAWINRKKRALSQLVSPAGWMLFIVIACSWYAWMYLQHPDALMHTLQKETDDTYISGDHKQPVYYYLTRGIGYYAPWSLLVIPCALWLWQQRATLPSLVRYALLWFLLVFTMLSFNANKQAHYSLLLAPSLAILLGYYLQHADGRHRTGITVFGAITTLACAAWNIHLLARLPFHISYLIAFIIVPLAATGIYKYHGRLPAIVLAASGMAALCITLTAIQKEALPGNALFDQKQLGEQARQAGYRPLFFYPAMLDEILFYAGGPIPELKNTAAITTALQTHAAIYVFATAQDAENLTNNFNPSVITSNKHFRLLKIGAEP
ncbi:MAG TPA: glycosyltransferase family 39 protein [Pseudomonadales bacterium]|nr:glycosyltransferase family 39 protein [Pseudomonadales bacterium]